MRLTFIKYALAVCLTAAALQLTLFVITANAAPRKVVPVRAVVALGPYGFEQEQAGQLLRDAFALVERDNAVTLRLVALTQISNPLPDSCPGNYSPCINSLHQEWDDWYRRHRGLRRGINVVIAPPLRLPAFGGNYAIGGATHQDCAFSRRKESSATVAAVFVTPSSLTSGEDRYMHSVYTLAHELGHALGAAHDSSQPSTLMDTGLLYHLAEQGFDMHMSGRSRREVTRCLAAR